jgi:hypothetical protein
MPKKAIRKTPTDLPPSRLFLDDLREIEEYCRSRLKGGCSIESFLYSVDNKFTFDSIEELNEHGGSAKTLDMEVHRRGNSGAARQERSAILSLGRFNGAVLGLPDCLTVSFPEFCGFVRQIFSARRRVLAAAVAGAPTWVLTSLSVIGAISFWCFLALSFRLGGYTSDHHFGRTSATLAGIALCAFWVFFVIVLLDLVGLPVFRGKFLVHFQFEGTAARERKAKSRELRRTVGLMVLSAVIGVLGTLAVQWLGSRLRR